MVTATHLSTSAAGEPPAPLAVAITPAHPSTSAAAVVPLPEVIAATHPSTSASEASPAPLAEVVTATHPSTSAPVEAPLADMAGLSLALQKDQVPVITPLLKPILDRVLEQPRECGNALSPLGGEDLQTVIYPFCRGALNVF